jgi:hypothetical protein
MAILAFHTDCFKLLILAISRKNLGDEYLDTTGPVGFGWDLRASGSVCRSPCPWPTCRKRGRQCRPCRSRFRSFGY